MSQINPYSPIVVPIPRPPKAWPKKQQGNGKQREREEQPKEDEEKKDGDGLDLKA